MAKKKKMNKKVTKKIASKASKKKPAKAKKAPKKKIAKKATKKKVAKKVAKKKVAKKATKKKVAKKVAKKKVAKKVAKKKVAKKVAKKKVAKKVAKKVKIEKLPPAPIGSKKIVPIAAPVKDEDDLLLDEVETDGDDSKPSSKEESSHSLTDEYNTDDEQEHNAFGYGWSYNEGLDSPEEIESSEDLTDEDAEYATSGKPVGYDLDNDD